MTEQREDLFQPTIQDAPAAQTGRPPWRLDSLLYASFFAGPIGAAILGWLNSRRLGSEQGSRVALLTGIAVSIAFAIGARVWSQGAADPLAWMGENRTSFRLASRAAGVLVYFVYRTQLTTPHRLYELNAPGDEAEFSSLWIPGIAFAFLGPAALAALVVAVHSFS